jgi:hypothetical protein
MNKVEERLKSKAIIRNGIMLFSKEDAIEFVNNCKNEMIELLGIDCFILGDDWIQPNMENSVDFSNLSVEINRYNKAINFIVTRDNQFYFEIVCND